MSVLDALKGVLKLALMHDGLARGLREASKALDRRQAHMCVLNEACEEEDPVDQGSGWKAIGRVGWFV
jgi:small subunit ribosomal protein S12e